MSNRRRTKLLSLSAVCALSLAGLASAETTVVGNTDGTRRGTNVRVHLDTSTGSNNRNNAATVQRGGGTQAFLRDRVEGLRTLDSLRQMRAGNASATSSVIRRGGGVHTMQAGQAVSTKKKPNVLSQIVSIARTIALGGL